MKYVFLLACLIVSVSLGSCQCSNKPDIGPVEEEAGAVLPGGAPPVASARLA